MRIPKMAPVVDNCDWLKTGAIMMVAVGHIGYFFVDDAAWWSVFGRMAAPTFFFLMGYARSRQIPLKWIWFGVILTLLDSWNMDWEWMAPNILFSLAFIRLTRPYVLGLLQRYGWVSFILVICALLMVLPVAGDMVDYGAEGWLWALFGLCQRMYVDGEQVPATSAQVLRPNWQWMRRLIGPVAASVYVWQEQLEFFFSESQFIAVIVGVGALSIALFLFVRGSSRLQPPAPFARALHFLGRNTLAIYVIQLAGSEVFINVFPDLAA